MRQAPLPARCDAAAAEDVSGGQGGVCDRGHHLGGDLLGGRSLLEIRTGRAGKFHGVRAADSGHGARTCAAIPLGFPSQCAEAPLLESAAGGSDIVSGSQRPVDFALEDALAGGRAG